MKDSYIVADGLTEGEEIVTNGTFSVDAAAQLAGKPSMMNQEGGITNTMPGMDMSDHSKTDSEESVINSKQSLTHITFGVSGNCEMCKDRIESAAASVNGVKSAEWDIKKKTIHVEYNSKEAQPTAIQEAIAKAGHDTELIKADDKVYDALPECCLYRK